MRVLRLFVSKELGRKNCFLSGTLIHFEAFNLFEWVEKDSAFMPVDFCGSWIQAIDIWHQYFSGPALLIGAIAIPPMLSLKWFKSRAIWVTLLNSAKSWFSFGDKISLTRGISKAASQKCPLDPLKANLERLLRKFLDKKRVYFYLKVYNARQNNVP